MGNGLSRIRLDGLAYGDRAPNRDRLGGIGFCDLPDEST
jgi:hypothetical protein